MMADIPRIDKLNIELAPALHSLDLLAVKEIILHAAMAANDIHVKHVRLPAVGTGTDLSDLAILELQQHDRVQLIIESVIALGKRISTLKTFNKRGKHGQRQT